MSLNVPVIIANACSDHCPNNCIRCSQHESTRCVECEPGFILRPDNTCTRTFTCARHCLHCTNNGAGKCDRCESGYTLTHNNICSQDACTEKTENCMKEWKSLFSQTPPRSTRSPHPETMIKACNILPDVKECLEDEETACQEHSTWAINMQIVSSFEQLCAPSTVRIPTKTPVSTSTSEAIPSRTPIATSTTERIPTNTTSSKSASTTERISTKTPSTSSTSTSTTEGIPSKTPSTTSTSGSRGVVMVIRLSMTWKDSYNNFTNEETKDLVTSLRKFLQTIYRRVKGFRDVQVRRLFKSSVGVEHFVEFDHDLTDTERTAIALTLTSALAVNSDTLTWRGEKVEISDKAEMLVAGNKVEVNGACFLYDKKQLCKNGGSCVATEASANCVCSPAYRGVYCETRVRSSATKSKDVIGPVVGGIGAVLFVGILIFALLFYKRRLQHHSAAKQGSQMQNDGVDNPLYVMSPSGVDSSTRATPPGGVDNPVYCG
ncbi:hypothetical protein LSAT2_017411 [Lamellibrachia satsuma]|nr:hypothetical protein LSAT2_017411 [Lamellibrachia satsuma]